MRESKCVNILLLLLLPIAFNIAAFKMSSIASEFFILTPLNILSIPTLHYKMKMQ